MENRWALDGHEALTYYVEVDGTPVTVELVPDGMLRIGERTFHLDVSEICGLSLYSLLLDGTSYEVVVDEEHGMYYALVRGKVYRIKVGEGAKPQFPCSAEVSAEGEAVICAPLCGQVVDVLVSVGLAVEVNQVIVVLESMKMENEIRSPRAGTVREVRAQIGSIVREGDVLAIVD